MGKDGITGGRFFHDLPTSVGENYPCFHSAFESTKIMHASIFPFELNNIGKIGAVNWMDNIT